MKEGENLSYWAVVWRQFRARPIGLVALWVVGLFALLGLYAPFLASSKPLMVIYDGDIYFPLFRYLFFRGFFTKRIDLFYNLLMFYFPFGLWIYYRAGYKKLWWTFSLASFPLLFIWVAFGPSYDPASDPVLNGRRQAAIQASRHSEDPMLGPLPRTPSLAFDRQYITPYDQLNRVLRFHSRRTQHEILQGYRQAYALDEQREWLSRQVREKRKGLLAAGVKVEELPSREILEGEILDQGEQKEWDLPTLWLVEQENAARKRADLLETLQELKEAYAEAQGSYANLEASYRNGGPVQPLREARRTMAAYEGAQAELDYSADTQAWLEAEAEKLSLVVWPLVRRFHWEDDAGGEQSLNQYVDWWHLTRINRKDLVAGLIFGIRISLMVGVTAVLLSLAIGIPVGALAGYYGGRFDILTFRFIEIWESMPVFFMLLMVVAITQSKSIFLVVAVLGIFGWTGFSRYIRGEFLKQRHLPYVDACRAMGFTDGRIIFSHVLPNAIPPLLTLLPFAVLGAITSEAGLSFLGLGEEGSCSWGVLMDEGRTAFPGESYLLWPPAILLTLLLVAIALVGDALRDALDPKMRH